MSDPKSIPVSGGDQPATEITWDFNTGDKTVVTDNGSRVSVFNGSTHSWSTYNQSGELTGGGVGETHPH